MSAQQPAWLKRSRPCPFFSQGRCLFADSCNFLHDVKVKTAVNLNAVPVDQSSLLPQSVFDPPSVVVNAASPLLPGLGSPASTVQDSSRYSGLLSVLSDVIGPPSPLPIVPSRVNSTWDSDMSTCTVGPEQRERSTSSSKEQSSIHHPDAQVTLADSLTFPESSESADVATPHVVEDTEAYVIGEEEDDDDQDHGEEDPTVNVSNRQSTFSSFTGASLLASTRSVFGGSSFSPIGDGVDLLSPVQLSAKLRPFPIPPRSRVKRWDSVDSGCADADAWVGPTTFPRSPPRSCRSSMIYPTYSRRASHSSPAFKNRAILSESGVPRPSPGVPTDVIEEVEIDEGLEDNEYTIMGSYDRPPFEEQGEETYDHCKQVNLADVEGVVEEGKASRRHSIEHLRRARECDLDLCNLPSFVSDDNLSFRTALSTQPSCEDLSNISKESLVKQESLRSSISGYSTPNTSVLSHYGDASESLEQPIVGTHSHESPYLTAKADMASRINSSAAPEANTSEDRSLSEGRVIDSDVLLVPASEDDQRSTSEVIAPRGRPSGVFHFSKRSSISSSSTNTSGSPPLVKNCSPLFKDAFDSTLSEADGLQQFAPEDVIASRNPLPSNLQYDQLSSPFQGLYHLTSRQDVGVQEIGPKNIVIQQNHFSAISDCDGYFQKPSSSINDVAEHSLGNDHLPRSMSSTESSQTSSLIGNARSGAYGESSRSSRRLADTSDDDFAYRTDQSLVVEDNLAFDEVSESFDSEHDSFTQRLSSPLSHSFLPSDSVGDSTPTFEDEVTVANVRMDGSRVCTVSQRDVVQRMRSGSDRTERAMPSKLPSTGSPGSDSSFSLRRARAASDLTVKGESLPPTTPQGSPCISKSLPLPLEQPDRSDSVQSLYDQYFDDCSSDSDDGSSQSPPHMNTLPSATSPKEECSERIHVHALDLTSHVLRTTAVPRCNTESNDSGTDFPPSETVFRPFLTGRRSSLAELVPKSYLANTKQSSSPIHPSIRLQVREIGSTMVPLGFRRHKPGQPAARQSLQSASQPLHTDLPASGIREALRIRTDIVVGDDSHQACSSAGVPLTIRSPLPTKSMSAPPTGGLRQLRLSSIINKRSSILSTNSSSIASSTLSLDHTFNASTPQSPSVSSATSFSRNSVLSSSCEPIPEQTHHTLKRSSSNSLILQAAVDGPYAASQSSFSCCSSPSVSVPVRQSNFWRLSHYRAGSRNYTPADMNRRLSKRASTLSLAHAVDEEQEINEDDSNVSYPTQPKYVDDLTRPTSARAAPAHAIATPKPTLLFAIASDNVDQVRRALESGEAGPNDSIGPQSALAFTLTNNKLTHKQEIVKALLAYGANPSALRNPTLNPALRREEDDGPSIPPSETTLEGMDPATRYFVARADSAHTRQTSQLIYRSFFRPLTRVRYDVIGQDWALEQLFRVLGMYSQKLSAAPIVVLLCGPSGHGKSLLARKFGSLLDVPTHTVNMTTLRSTHDIWQSYSMSPYEEPSSCTLAEFLIENEGRRCVVVLDEIEKVEDQKALWSLLMPWELGRCSLEAGKRHVNARDVIWIGTSNIGHKLIFEHHENRTEPEERMSREEYLGLTGALRPRVSYCLGASLVSRVTAILPFVPFTLDERKAITAEAVYALAGDASQTMSPQDVECLVTKALPHYHPNEGARSLHRALSNILVDAI